MHALQRSNHGRTQDELEELRVRYALLQSSGTDVDFTTRVDHLNDRLIARLQTWSKINGKVIEGSDKDDQILELGRNITPEQRQLLQLGVAQVRLTPVCVSRTTAGYEMAALNVAMICFVPQDNILELRSWLARFRIPDSGDSESLLRLCLSVFFCKQDILRCNFD